MSPQTRFFRFDGLTVFAAFAFVGGLAAMPALDRVGAPEGVVRAGGPILALFAFAAFGLGARNVDLDSFVSAGRRLPPVYGGLGVAAIAAGVLFCLDEPAASSDPPLLGLALGLALGALLYGPLIRRVGATSPADVMATRYPRSLARLVSAAAIWAGGALTAFAGFSVAVETFANAGANHLLAESGVAAVLALGALSGLPAVAACAAAGGAAFVGLAAVAYASGWRLGVAPADVAAFGANLDLGSPAAFAPVVATALAGAGLFAFAPPSAASGNAGSAFKAGFVAVALCAALAAAAGAGAEAPSPGRIAASPVAASLFGAAILASALSLALLGVYASSRALGLTLADAARRSGPIPSVRLARMRAAELIVIVGCVVCYAHDLLDARIALTAAMALLLAFTVPLLTLAAIPRVGAASASDGTLAALAAAAFRLAPATGLPGPSEMFETALLAAAAAFAAGSLSCLIRPRPASAPAPRREPVAETAPRAYAAQSLRPTERE